MSCFLGADVGGTKTDVVVVDDGGHVLGAARVGRGNPEDVGHDGMLAALREATSTALAVAGVDRRRLGGAGFGIAGYDWPEDLPPIAAAVAQLELGCPVMIVNDTIPLIVLGSPAGWGVGLVAGTGCNCRGWDLDRREGRVTGHSWLTGEHAGASELVRHAMQMVAWAWTRRGEPTALTQVFVDYTGAHDVDDLIAGYTKRRLRIRADAAPLVFAVAATGDPVAQQLVNWAGCELGELVNAVVRQPSFHDAAFDVVLAGGLFEAGEPLLGPLRRTVHTVAPSARFVPLAAPPALGAALLGIDAAGMQHSETVRATLLASNPYRPTNRPEPRQPTLRASVAPAGSVDDDNADHRQEDARCNDTQPRVDHDDARSGA